MSNKTVNALFKMKTDLFINISNNSQISVPCQCMDHDMAALSVEVKSMYFQGKNQDVILISEDESVIFLQSHEVCQHTGPGGMHHVVLGSPSQHLAVLAAALGHTGRPLFGGNQRFQPEMFGFCHQGLTDYLRLMI